MIDRIKKALDCKTDSELARKIEVTRNTVFRWNKSGFSPSIGRLIGLLLVVIRELTKELKRRDKLNKSKHKTIR